MTRLPKSKLVSLLALCFALLTASASAQGPTRVAVPDDAAISDAYIYLLGRVLVIRQEHMDRGAVGFAYNAMKYDPIGEADWVNPNLDTAYIEAWFAVDPDAPVIFEVPEIEGRYYTAQILDEWGEVIANINERMFPSKPFGKFALVYPNSNPKIPADATRIDLHSAKAKLLGRVEIKGDKDGATKLQHGFKATAAGSPKLKDPPPVPMFGNRDLIGVEIFDDADAKLASALDVAPNAAQMQQKVRAVAAYAASSPEAHAAVDARIRKTVPEFIEYTFTKSAPYRDHWVGGGRAGNYGADYLLRTVANYAGIWANTSDEVIYFIATRDSGEQTLNGSNSYVIHFPANKLPENVIDAFWSVILVGVPDYRVVPNALNRFNFNNYSPLQKEPDGSLKITLGPTPVAGVPESNWLPTPEGKPFSLTFRTYVPKEIVKTGEWRPAPVVKID
ncbi:DUF1214 domain-containing protein [Bradyrhizobium sp. LA2.1]|uniref:DUF1214 domain-containing protein n=1 Tax=Bradyrhizobium sp. LA2.1 TaxID=3156376 RepID=UPI00339306B8